MVIVETMRWGRGVVGLTFVTLWMGCSSFDAAEAERERARNEAADAGPEAFAPVTGSALGTYDVTVDVPPLRHGRAVSAHVAVTRSPQFPRELRVDLVDPPAGITAEMLTLAPDVATGELKITATASVPQGPIKLTVRINAPGTTLDDVLLPKDVAVQGAPGELDTSFGTNGVFETPNASRIWPAASGSFFLGLESTRGGRKFSVNSMDPAAESATFGSATGSMEGVTHYQAASGRDRLVLVNNTPVTGPLPYPRARLAGISSAGVRDGFIYNDNEMTADTFALRTSDAKMAVVGHGNEYAPNLNWRVRWLNADGSADRTVNADALTLGGVVQYFSIAAYAAGALYMSDGASVARLLVPGGGPDAAFGGGGTLAFPGGTIVSAAIDAQQRFVGGGRDANGGLYMVRIAARQLDLGWDAKGYNVFGSSTLAGGRFVLDKAGNAFQVGTVSGGSSTQCLIIARSPSGTLLEEFGTRGSMVLPVDGCSGLDVLLTDDGKLLIAGPKTVRVWL